MNNIIHRMYKNLPKETEDLEMHDNEYGLSIMY